MIYFLDTNIISYIIKGKYPAIQSHFRKVPAQSIIIPSIVKAEIEYGAGHSSDYEKTAAPYKKFLEYFGTADFTGRAAFYYGIIREQLASAGSPIGPNDMTNAVLKRFTGKGWTTAKRLSARNIQYAPSYCFPF